MFEIQNELEENGEIFLQTLPRHQGPLPRGKQVLSNFKVFVQKYFIHMQKATWYSKLFCPFHILCNMFGLSFHIAHRVAKRLLTLFVCLIFRDMHELPLM